MPDSANFNRVSQMLFEIVKQMVADHSVIRLVPNDRQNSNVICIVLPPHEYSLVAPETRLGQSLDTVVRALSKKYGENFELVMASAKEVPPMPAARL